MPAAGRISLGDVTIDVIRKRMRSIRLSVHPPDGRVRMSAPLRMALDTLRLFATAKLDWIRTQQTRVRQQPRVSTQEFRDGEVHFVWGRPFTLRVEEVKALPTVLLREEALVLRVRPGATLKKKEAVLEAWYRNELEKAAPLLFAKWEPVMGVKVATLLTRRMRTRWGTCDTRTHSIRLNTELVKKPAECLEYVVVHEMTHLLEASHNRRFKALMTRFLPDWAERKRRLNRGPAAPHGERTC